MKRKRSKTHPAARLPRPSRRIHAEDPGKLSEPTACPDCGASYREGRWSWKPAPPDASPHVCPACERIATGYPAGVIRLEGRFVGSHREELLHLLRNLEERERSQHPLKRIMAITDEDAGITVTLTDAKLPLTFGRALSRAFEGSLEHPPTTSEQEGLVRVRWMRD